MASSSVEQIKMRPNIRVEIHNNLAEPMDTDDPQKSDEEEGEIVDDSFDLPDVPIKQSSPLLASKKISPTNTSTSTSQFITGINIFDKQERDKLEERAKRFQLNPDEIRTFNDDDLHQIHLSLGLTVENQDNVRFDAIHMIGIDQMTTEDILDYFVKYAPVSIERISDGHGCNVVWLDVMSSARAMHFMSKVIRGLPVRGGVTDSLMDTSGAVVSGGKSVLLLKNKDREVELKDDEENRLNIGNSIDISEIPTTDISIPPGYWRLGVNHVKSKCILLRFAFKTDEKPYKIEQLSRYYNKKKSGIFERNKDLKKENNYCGDGEKNPWGVLARNWDEDRQYREQERVLIKEEPILVKNPSILVRLGQKNNTIESLSPTQPKTINSDQEEEEEEEDNQKMDGQKMDQDVESVKTLKKKKIPRMRMYADEEEEKVKRKKFLQTINKHYEKISVGNVNNSYNVATNDKSEDLRNILGITTNRGGRQRPRVNSTAVQEEDLGSRLKNRNKKMIFSINTEEEEPFDDQLSLSPAVIIETPNQKLHSNHHHEEGNNNHRKRDRSPIRHHNHHHHHRGGGRRSSPEDRHRHHHHNKSHHRHDHHHHHHHDSLYSDKYDNQKTRSKVAVVIKTHKRPMVASTVAPTVWSRINRFDGDRSETSSSASSSLSEKSQSDSESGSDSSSSSDEEEQHNNGDVTKTDEGAAAEQRTALKIKIRNDYFKDEK